MDASTVTDAGADTNVNVVEAPPGTCTFGESGAEHESPAGDISTFAIRDGNSVTIQCGSHDATNTFSLQLAFSEVGGAGTFTKGLAQYSEQLTNGGSPTLYRSMKASLVISTLTDTSVAATISFDGDSTSGKKSITASLNVPIRK